MIKIKNFINVKAGAHLALTRQEVYLLTYVRS
jgi:hypothetical protein